MTLSLLPQTILGKTVYRPAKLDQQLVKDLQSLAQPDDGFETIAGKTMCANDFYEGQGRLDGAFCEYGEEEKMEFLRKLRDFGGYTAVETSGAGNLTASPLQVSSTLRWSARRLVR